MSMLHGIVLAYGRRKQKLRVDIVAHAVAMTTLHSR